MTWQRRGHRAGPSPRLLVWYRKAASQNLAAAQYNLGVLLGGGGPLPRDFREAFKWFLRAAEQGHVAAQYNLGVMYANGRGVAQDSAEAAKWYRRAAQQGNASAQYNLGAMHLAGDGVRDDPVEAYLWLTLALAGFPPARVAAATSPRSSAAPVLRMTPAEIDEASGAPRPGRPSFEPATTQASRPIARAPPASRSTSRRRGSPTRLRSET
jgi:hypothetical protein